MDEEYDYEDEGEAALPAYGAQEAQYSAPASSGAPTFIPYHPSMNAQQRRMIDMMNSRRMNEYRQEQYTSRSQANQRAIMERQEAGRNFRAQQSEIGRNFRVEREDARETGRQAAELRREKYAADRRDATEQMRIAAEERAAQRRQNNGMTEEDIRSELNQASAPVVSAYRDMIGQAMTQQPRETALPLELRGEGGFQNPSQAFALPQEAQAPRTPEQAMGAIDSGFAREFAAPIEGKVKAAKTRQERDAALEERDLAAADVAARVSRKDRRDLDAVDTFINDKEAGLFTRPDPNNPNKRVYIGDKITPLERTAIRNWSWRLAEANPSMPPETAAQSVMSLLAVEKGEDGKPIVNPNYKITLDPRTGRGRVALNNGLIAFNLDRETLRQIAFARQAEIEKLQKAAKTAAKRKDTEAEIARLKAEAESKRPKPSGFDARPDMPPPPALRGEQGDMGVNGLELVRKPFQ